MPTSLTSMPRSEWLRRVLAGVAPRLRTFVGLQAPRPPGAERPVPLFGITSVVLLALGFVILREIQRAAPQSMQSLVGGLVAGGVFLALLPLVYLAARAGIRRHERAIGFAWVGMGAVLLFAGSLVTGFVLDLAMTGILPAFLLLGLRR